MDDKPFESLNMVPFIDIMLVLLVIVLTTSTFIASGKIPITLPQASSGESIGKENRIIEIDQHGVVYFNHKAVNLSELTALIVPIAHEQAFLLRADKTVPLQSFINVAELLHQQGFVNVAVETESGPVK